MASNMILHTPPNTQHVEKIVFSCKFGLKCVENVRKLPDAPRFSQTQPTRQGLVGAVNLQNTTMASDVILNTPPSTHQVEKMVSRNFKLQIWAKVNNFLHFFMLRRRQFQFFAIYEKMDGFRA